MTSRGVVERPSGNPVSELRRSVGWLITIQFPLYSTRDKAWRRNSHIIPPLFHFKSPMVVSVVCTSHVEGVDVPVV